MRSISIFLIPCLFLAACGSGGGVSSPAAGGGTGQTAQASRSVPGGDITLTTGAIAGSFTISTTVADVTSVEVLAGPDYDSAQPVTVTSVSADSWTGSAATSNGLLIRLHLADGSVIESAVGDFAAH